MIFDPKIETMDRASMRALQLERLKRIVQYAYDKVPFYRNRMDAAGVKPSHIRTLRDIEKIPVTTKDDLRDNYPYGLFARPMREIVRLHASSGTTGKPIVAGYTRGDLDMWSDCIARLITAVGGNDEDIVQISFGYGLFTGGFGLHQGWEKIGATVVPISAGNTERQVMLMKDFGATVLISTPSYGLHIAEIAKKMGVTKADLKLRLGMFGSEASTAEMHRELADKLGLFPTDNYGLTEVVGPGVSGECLEKCGMHINEDHFYPEIFDFGKGRACDPGEYGELLLTTLTKEGMPILRYRTKDITCLDEEPCRCGRTTVRMKRIKGRTDDMIKIRGVNVFPSQIESVLLGMEEVGNHYEIILTRANYTDAIEVKVEVVDEHLLDNFKQLEELERKVKTNLKTVLQLDAKVSLVEPLSLKRYEGKTKRVIDLRNKGTI